MCGAVDDNWKTEQDSVAVNKMQTRLTPGNQNSEDIGPVRKTAKTTSSQFFCPDGTVLSLKGCGSIVYMTKWNNIRINYISYL